jgi:hypothetical protein
MKKELKRSMIVGALVLTVLLTVGAAAQACLLEHESGRRLRQHWDSPHHSHHMNSDLNESRTWGPLPSSSMSDDDGWKKPSCIWSGGSQSGWYSDHLERSWAPFGLFGGTWGKWSDLFKNWDFDKLMEHFKESPALVFFGGLVRPMFVAIVLPFDAIDWNGGPPDPPNPTPTPVPAAALLLGTGLAGFGLLKRRQRRQQG